MVDRNLAAKARDVSGLKREIDQLVYALWPDAGRNPNCGRLSEMNTPEIMFNLWYVHGGDGFIYSLRARAYVGTGNEEENLAFLQRLAPTDYLVAKPFSIPEPFHIRQAVTGKTEDETLPVAHVSAITQDAVACTA